MSAPAPAATPMPSPPPPSSLLDYTLRTAPLTVVMGTASCTALGALTGSALGIIRNYPAIPAAFKTGINTGVFSFTFFSTREYVLLPLLIAVHLHPSPLENHAPAPHTHNLVPSFLAGSLSGTAFASYMRGGPPTASLRAGVTLGLGCTLAQSVMNELGVVRIKLLAWGEEREARLAAMDEIDAQVAGQGPLAETKEAPPTYTRPISSPRPSVPSRETFSERSDRLISTAWSGIWEKLGRLAPLKKMDEGEYVERLEKRMAEIEEERRRVAEERKELEKRRGDVA